MRGECLDDHGNGAPGEDTEPGNDGTDGWSTIEKDGDGNITAKVDSDFRPRRLMMFGRTGKTR